MNKISLYDHQREAIDRMKNGCILCGGVGSGKSRTSIAYYFEQQKGVVSDTHPMKMKKPKDLYIITTARKRDTHEWDEELLIFGLSPNPDENSYKNTIKIDSWNNIQKYREVEGAFFIFDEQRVVGSGVWVKAFLKIAKKNDWILLSATPGDSWGDYIPVFIANGFYRTRSEFIKQHVVYSRFSKYPKVDRYLDEWILNALRNKILITMDFERQTVSHHEDLYSKFDNSLYRTVLKDRWNPYKDEPIMNASGLCYTLRKIVNTDPSRGQLVLDILEDHPKAIIFYNFDYELDILKNLDYKKGTKVAEWNGHQHQELPTGNKWVYLVQYQSGAEGWNCITTDTVIFFSQNYSYKVLQQAQGRIDRLNTPYENLYYFHLKSRSKIDLAISKAIKQKKNFSESAYVNWK